MNNLKKKLNVGIDVTRSKSGGGVSHIKGILSSLKKEHFIFNEVHVWGYRKLLDQIPDYPWLIKHNPPLVEKSLPFQVFWQRFLLPIELKENECRVVLNTDAGTLCRFKPCVTMSRDMLSYEPGELDRYRLGKFKVRLLLLKYLQNKSLRDSTTALFLTNHAAKTIMKSTGPITKYAIVNHGLSESFRLAQKPKKFNFENPKEKEFKCIYVSPIYEYKHQWNVIEAISSLRKDGFNLKLELIGGGEGDALKRVQDSLKSNDPKGEFISLKSFVDQSKLPHLIADADIFIFASSCENMPNTLIEGMASGLPILCSNKGPMPEVLEDGGLYFNPEAPKDLESCLRELLSYPSLANSLSQKSFNLSKKYTWERCAQETFSLLEEVYKSCRETS